MQKKITCLLPLFILIHAGCSGELSKKSQDSDVRIESLKQEQIQTTIIPGDNFNQYKVELSWPDAKGTIRVVDQARNISDIKASDKKFVGDAEGGTEVAYLLEQISDDGRVTASLPITVPVPKDVLLKGEMSLKEDLVVESGRVFLDSSLVLKTNQFKLHIHADTLKSARATIKNFDESDTQTEAGSNGLNGGDIEIKASHSSGILTLNLRGQNGGPGKTAFFVLGRPCMPGSGATGGSSGMVTFESFDSNTFSLIVNRFESNGGLPGPVLGQPGFDKYAHTDSCQLEKPQSGKKGDTGALCERRREDTPIRCM